MLTLDGLLGLSPYRHWHNGLEYSDNWEQTMRKVALAVFVGGVIGAGASFIGIYFVGTLTTQALAAITFSAVVLTGSIIHWITRPAVRQLSDLAAEQEMLFNGKLALMQHRDAGNKHVVDPEEIYNPNSPLRQANLQRLRFTSHHVSEQGPRATMEDKHLFKEAVAKKGFFASVWDGHAGSDTAEYAAARLNNEFFDEIANTSNVLNAIERLIHRIHRGAVKSRFFSGAAGVIFYADPQGRPFVATMADSKAEIWRKINGVWKCIPMSKAVSWSEPTEARRAAIALDNPFVAVDWTKTKGKQQRYKGLNVSRALGDPGHCGPDGTPAVIHKMEIASLPISLKPDDRVLVACDGIWDYVNPDQMHALLEEYEGKSIKELTDAISKKALQNMGYLSIGVDGKEKVNSEVTGDNATIVGVDVKGLFNIQRPAALRKKQAVEDIPQVTEIFDAMSPNDTRKQDPKTRLRFAKLNQERRVLRPGSDLSPISISPA